MRLLLILFVMLFTLSACKAETPESMQIIIKYSDGLTQEQGLAEIDDLLDSHEVVLEYLRPMSGGAHVYRTSAITPFEWQELSVDLSAKDSIVYVEKDRRMTIQR